MVDPAQSITIALAGNPNSGKTTLFNQITGTRQHVGNYPGVTVEKKEGFCIHQGVKIHVVDLPGIYSLTARSAEELVARNYILEEKPDVIVDILDASNIERNLYLYTQLMELNVPLVLVLNMSDMAKARGIEFDLENLSNLLGAPIVPTVGHKGGGIHELLDMILAVATGAVELRPVPMNLGRDIEKEIEKIQQVLESEGGGQENTRSRWMAIKLLESDRDVTRQVQSPEIRAVVEQSALRIEKLFGDHPEIIIADQRYGIISGACQEAIRLTVEARHTYSDKIDEILTNRILGLPIFLFLMYLIFQFTFALGQYPVTWLETLFGWTGDTLRSFGSVGSENILLSLLVDGVIGGVGGVIVFVPNIFLLFLAIAVLEDTGYMARAAFNMDRFMHKIGLHGKSFIPMLIGFGCSVPAIMATRTLENQRDRFTTMMVIPLMSCGARLPIYTLIIPAFFSPIWQAPLLWILYLIGILLAIGGAKILRSTLFKGENEPFIMELPPYRIPTIKGISIHVFERTWLYLKKAGTVILGISVVLWAMMYFPVKEQFDRDYAEERAQAEQTYQDRIANWHSQYGIPFDAQKMVQAMGERREENREDDSFAIGDPDLTRFLSIYQAIEEVWETFDQTVEREGVEKNTLDHALLVRVRDSNLAKIEKREPEFFPAAIHYIDTIEQPYTESLLSLQRAKHAEKLSYSLAGRVGKFIEPALIPLGFDWKIGTALIGAFAAKEVFIAQLGIVYSLGESEEHSQVLREQLQDHYTPLAAFCIMLFCLIALPCMATFAATRLESGSWKWAFFQFFSLTSAGYLLTLIVYQSGRFLGIGL